MENQNSDQSPAVATEEAVATKNGGNATQEVSSTTKAVDQNSDQSPAAATEEAVATKNGGNATVEVSSTTKNVELTKRSLRVQTWKKMKQNKFVVHYWYIFNRIPGFVDSDKAGKLLAETDEFKSSKNIKVLIDRSSYAARLQTLLANKNLYLPSIPRSKALFFKVDVSDSATEEEKAKILHVRSIENSRTEIFLENKVELDMVIIGSVVVSREGHRIGRGNGFHDLDIGLLCEVGAITNNTVIATMVHDSQVVDTLPHELFQKYDAPVDMIITPTQVIRVAKRLPRPTGIFWELLSERRLKIVPALQELKETQEKAGKVIVLKEEDTDIEHEQPKNRRRFAQRGRFGDHRRFKRRTVSQNNTDQQQREGNHGQEQKHSPSQRRRFVNRRRRPSKFEGDESRVDSKSQDRKPVGNDGKRRRRPRKNFMVHDFSVKLTNITRDVHVKDLKKELRDRQCNPMALTWRGYIGFCYLHYGHRNGKSTSEDEVNRVLQALNDLSLTVTPNSFKNKSVTVSTNGEGEGAAAAAVVAGDGEKQVEEKEEANSGDVPSASVINLKVELMKRTDKAKQANEAAGAGGAVNGGGDAASGGDASAARIESVDTTTV